MCANCLIDGLVVRSTRTELARTAPRYIACVRGVSFRETTRTIWYTPMSRAVSLAGGVGVRSAIDFASLPQWPHIVSSDEEVMRSGDHANRYNGRVSRVLELSDSNILLLGALLDMIDALDPHGQGDFTKGKWGPPHPVRQTPLLVAPRIVGRYRPRWDPQVYRPEAATNT